MANKSERQQSSSNISEEQQRKIEEDVAKEIERKQEASKAAQKAIYAKRKAKELVQAARGAADPDERQKLLNEALEKEVEAETFGKTAKYLQSGAFQGMIAGTGLGGGIGVWLGVVTGTLVGGTTGLLTGGIGAGVGAGVGAIHGPFVKIGHLMGDGIRKITGDIPGWKATKEQKAALEKMVRGVQEAEVPDDDELEKIRAEGAEAEQISQSWKETAASYMPFKSSMPSVPGLQSGEKKDKTEVSLGNSQTPAKQGVQDQTRAQNPSQATQSKLQPGQAVNSTGAQKNSPSSTSKPNNTAIRTNESPSDSSKKDGVASGNGQSTSSSTRSGIGKGQNVSSTTTPAPVERKASAAGIETKKKPRKLEVRSNQQSDSAGNRRKSQPMSG